MFGFHFVAICGFPHGDVARYIFGLKITNGVIIEKYTVTINNQIHASQQHSSLGGSCIPIFYLNLSYFDGEKFGFAPNPYSTCTKPVLTRSVSGKTLGFCKNLGFFKPVLNPY
jgi:hypothetical protein